MLCILCDFDNYINVILGDCKIFANDWLCVCACALGLCTAVQASNDALFRPSV